MTNQVVQLEPEETGIKAYYDKGSLSMTKLFIPVFRAFLTLTTQYMINQSYFMIGQYSREYNTGIIASLFTTSIIFSAVLFKLFYGQTNSWMALFGMSFIFGAVCFISIGEGLGDVKNTNDISFFY